MFLFDGGMSTILAFKKRPSPLRSIPPSLDRRLTDLNPDSSSSVTLYESGEPGLWVSRLEVRDNGVATRAMGEAVRARIGRPLKRLTREKLAADGLCGRESLLGGMLAARGVSATNFWCSGSGMSPASSNVRLISAVFGPLVTVAIGRGGRGLSVDCDEVSDKHA